MIKNNKGGGASPNADIRVGVDVDGEDIYFTVVDKSTNTMLYSGNDPDKVRGYKINQLIIDEQDLSHLVTPTKSSTKLGKE